MKVCVTEILILLCPHTLKFSLALSGGLHSQMQCMLEHVVKDTIQLGGQTLQSLQTTQEGGATPWWVSPTQIDECIRDPSFCSCCTQVQGLKAQPTFQRPWVDLVIQITFLTCSS